VSDTSVHTLAVADPSVEIPPQPFPDVDSQGFWDATSQGELAICRCQTCRAWMHPPLERCRRCGGETAFEPIGGRGRIHSFIVMHRSSVPGLGPPPHVIALVEFDDTPGIRLTGMLVGVAPSDVEIGAPVLARIVDVPGGDFRAPEFVPVPGDGA
jgi:uncharacterized OB-fold protein